MMEIIAVQVTEFVLDHMKSVMEEEIALIMKMNKTAVCFNTYTYMYIII